VRFGIHLAINDLSTELKEFRHFVSASTKIELMFLLETKK